MLSAACRNPLSALELHIPAATLSSPTTPQQDDDAQAAAMSQAEARADHIIEARGGAVLGPLTILKEDYFPGAVLRPHPEFFCCWVLLLIVKV